LNYFYEKILVERHVLEQAQLPGTVLRLPKVYGPGGNANLATIYGYRDRLGWRWTHGYVENVAAAIALAALHPAAANRVYNLLQRWRGVHADHCGAPSNSAFVNVPPNCG
jgi:nucleoside-diphosphate-sugar epimerase